MLVAGVLCVTAAAGPACTPDVSDPTTDDSFAEESDAALLPGPDCTDADVCLDAQARPQCFAALRDTGFAFQTYQMLDVPRAGEYSFVRILARRLFGTSPTGDLRVQLREFSPGGPWTPEAGSVIATATISGSAIPRTNTPLSVHFSPAVSLGLSNGPRPRYALVFDVPTGRLAVGLGCTATTGALAGDAGLRKVTSLSTTPVPRPWSASARDLSFAMGFNLASGVCPPAPLPACDDGNTDDGDGCSASCTVEPGFSCVGLPSACSAASAPGPVVAWSGTGTNGWVQVRRLVGTDWTEVGEPLVDPGGWAQAVAATLDAAGAPAVTWQGNDGLVHVRHWSGSGWTALGDLVDPGGWAQVPSIAWSASAGPALAWNGNDGRAHVRLRAGGNWTVLDSGLESPQLASLGTALALDPQGRLVLARSANNGLAYVTRWDGAGWVQLGAGLAVTGGGRPGSAASLAMALTPTGEPVLALRRNDGKIHVLRWSGAAWTELGTGIIDQAGFPSLPSVVVTPAGEPHVAWTGNDGLVYVSRWSGSAWASVGGGLTDPGGWANPPNLSLTSAGEPLVAFLGNDRLVWVRRWDGGTWTPVGEGLVDPGGGAGSPRLAGRVSP